MEQFLNKEIKSIIDKYPEVGNILNEYNIGCVPCGVGTCLLKDIVEIHNLPLEDETALMKRIAKVIYPDMEVEIPKIKREAPVSGEIKYSPPMKRLVDEHVFIKRLLAIIPEIINKLDLESEEGREIIIKSIDFIRNYADRYHHAKEEEILFKYFDKNLDILKVIHEDHETARAHVRAVIAGNDRKDSKSVIEHLIGYRELLIEHIKKEDEILYPWMDRNLDTKQIGELFSKFNEVEKEFKDAPREYEKFVTNMEKTFSKEEGKDKEELL